MCADFDARYYVPVAGGKKSPLSRPKFESSVRLDVHQTNRRVLFCAIETQVFVVFPDINKKIFKKKAADSRGGRGHPHTPSSLLMVADSRLRNL
jgi:hypothetical protein